MQKIINSVAIVAVFIFLGCNKKIEKPATETNNIETSASILGKWNIQELNSSLLSKNLSPFISSYTGKPGDYYDFKEDGTVDVRIGDKQAVMTYKLEGNIITVSFKGLITEALTISELTASKLKFSFNNELEAEQTITKSYSFNR